MEQIIAEELEAYREIMIDDTDTISEVFVLEKHEDGTTSSVMTARQATSLSDLEEFFVEHGMYEDATWAAGVAFSTKTIAEKSMKQSSIDDFFCKDSSLIRF